MISQISLKISTIRYFTESSQCGKLSVSKKTAYRVLGGNQAAPDTHPWMVRLSRAGTCGGTLVSHQHVLTAAHCEHFATREYAVLGDHNADVLEHGEIRVKIKSRIAHPRYWLDGETSGYDYAVLTLEHPVVFSKSIQPICLPNIQSEKYLGKTVITMGWGVSAWKKNWTNPKHGNDSALRAIILKVIPMSKCREAIWFKDRLKATNGRKINDAYMICAGHNEQTLNWKGVNKGDSGGRFFLPTYRGIDIKPK